MPQSRPLSTVTVAADAIRILGAAGQELATFALSFSVGTRAYTVQTLAACGDGYVGTTADAAVTVEILATASGVSVELRGAFGETDAAIYFVGSRVAAHYGRAFVPDADCRIFETRGTEDFYLTNSGMILQDQVAKRDLWMIAPPPHILSFGDDERGWCGLSIPVPMPVVATHAVCHDHAFHLAFEGYSPSHAGGRLPRVYIDAGLTDSKAIIDSHLAHARELGLIDATKPNHAWWHNPVYCTWGDQCYIQKTAPREQADVVSIHLDEAQIMRWADGIRAIYPGEVNYILDAGWFDHLGDFEPKRAAFATVAAFKGVLDRLKAKGFRAILWYTPFWVQPGSKVEIEHPEYLVRRRDGSVYRDRDQRAFLDYSHPAVRTYTQGRVDYMLRTLDADGFKIDMNYVFPLMTDVTLRDPSWGYGNHYWLEVLKHFHTTATALKDDAFFTISGIESYLQPYASSVRLNDLFDLYDATAWYNRAELVARLMPDVPIDVDGWPASVEKMREFQFVSPVFGAPVTYYIEATEVMSKRLTPTDLNRMASVWHVYSQAPCSVGMRLTIDADTERFERRDAHGRLLAIALQKSALACYTPSRIYLTANCDRAVSLPVEDAAHYTLAERVDRDGSRTPVSLFRDGRHLLLHVQDAGTGILCYEIS